MIANARMYSVCAQAALKWGALISAVAKSAGVNIEVIEHRLPNSIDELWRRTDMAAVFMCGLPFSRSQPRPFLIAAPIPSPAEFEGRPEYWSEWVVHRDSAFVDIEATFGGRLALTAPNSQSGYAAALQDLMPYGGASPLYREVIAPTMNPLGAVNAVISRAADIAPVDSFAFALLRKYRSDLTSQLRIVARTASTPIPALVASISGLSALTDAFLIAHQDRALRTIMNDLLLDRFVQPDAGQYDALRMNFETAVSFWRAHRLAEIVNPVFVV
jgi:ABC-type phosphate/phosphonate transport system substrate-binding protein